MVYDPLPQEGDAGGGDPEEDEGLARHLQQVATLELRCQPIQPRTGQIGDKRQPPPHFFLDFEFSQLEVAELTALTVTFLNFMSGGEPARLLEVIFTT